MSKPYMTIIMRGDPSYGMTRDKPQVRGGREIYIRDLPPSWEGGQPRWDYWLEYPDDGVDEPERGRRSRTSMLLFNGDVRDHAAGIQGPANLTIRSGNEFAGVHEAVELHVTAEVAGYSLHEMRFIRADWTIADLNPPEPEPDTLMTFQRITTRPDERYHTIRSGDSSVMLDKYWGGGGVSAVYLGREKVDDRDPGRLLNFDGLTGRYTPHWADDPLPDDPEFLRLENPTLTSMFGGSVFYPQVLSESDTHFQAIMQMPDFGGIAAVGSRNPRWLDFWTRYNFWLVDNQLVIDFAYFHTYDEPQPCTAFTFSHFLNVDGYAQSNRPDNGQGVFQMPEGHLRIWGPYGETVLFCPDPDAFFIHSWNASHVNGGVENIVNAPMKPPGTTNSHSGVRWTPNRLFASREEFTGRVVLSLDGNLDNAREAYSLPFVPMPPEPEVDYAKENHVIMRSLLRLFGEEYMNLYDKDDFKTVYDHEKAKFE